MRTLLLCVIALCSQVMSMTAQVTGRIEYPHRADYEDQVVLPVDDKGLVIQSFAKDSKEGKRYFKTEFYLLVSDKTFLELSVLVKIDLNL